jgi:hypothetical protein
MRRVTLADANVTRRSPSRPPIPLGKPLIDGNDRVTRACAIEQRFLEILLPGAQKLKPLRRSMGRATANHYWNRLFHSKPHPDYPEEGE